MPTQPGIDLSFSLLRLDQVHWLWDVGYRRISHCLWTGGYSPQGADGLLIAPRNIQTVLDTGLPFAQDGYIVVDDRMGSGQGAWHVDHGRAVLSEELWGVLVLLWTDVEQEQFEGTTFPTVRAAVERLVALGKPRRAIYTSRWKWAVFGNSPDFTDCIFWLADYRGNNPDPYSGFAPFPSCSLLNYAGKQFMNSHDEDGLNVDSSTFITEILAPQQQEEDEVDTDLRKWLAVSALFQQAAAFASQGKALPDDLRAQLKYLLG